MKYEYKLVKSWNMTNDISFVIDEVKLTKEEFYKIKTKMKK